MSIIKRNNDLFPFMPAFFNDVLTKDLWNWGMNNHSATHTTIPAVNIKETPESFEVEMAAPGMKKEDFKVELDNNLLTITSENQSAHQSGENEKYSTREFSYQSFQRTFQLPKEVVDVDKIEAKYENGLLHLTIPKMEEAKPKPSRVIQIA